jgi:hypothetical protein
MIMALLGFFAPFIPDLLGFGKQYLDHKQEMDMLRLRHENAKDEFTWRIEEIHTQADIAEMKAVRQPHKSYGVQLLDKAKDNDAVSKWVFNFVFMVFAWLDALISSVRPVITYWAFGLYTVVKSANLYAAYVASAQWSDGAVEALARTFTNEAAWTTFDQDMLVLIISFWFGQRARSRSTSNA